MTKVIVTGALGRMGREVIGALIREEDIDLAGGVDPRASEDYLDLPGGGGLIPLGRDLEAIITRVRPDVMVDFTQPEAAMQNVRTALRLKVSPVVGTSGISPANLEEIDRLANEAGVGAFVAPNFAIGANLMLHFARVASKYLGAAEIIEMHHDAKVDAPSGTAMSTARAMREARGEEFSDPPTTTFILEGARGGVEGGIRVHSVRLPGLVAHQEIIFGGPGQILTIRHDSLSRESFMPGVILAVKEVSKRSGLVYGLDRLMGLA
ncbi:MAG: 4-hydroxy-tetrahydrodipicolinate reductase [Chloroflexi bacterium]|nr:4-hydroxy-tetrahydrodipicolinate reductase [Chloroflexota bacterium]